MIPNCLTKLLGDLLSIDFEAVGVEFQQMTPLSELFLFSQTIESAASSRYLFRLAWVNFLSPTQLLYYRLPQPTSSPNRYYLIEPVSLSIIPDTSRVQYFFAPLPTLAYIDGSSVLIGQILKEAKNLEPEMSLTVCQVTEYTTGKRNKWQGLPNG